MNVLRLLLVQFTVVSNNSNHWSPLCPSPSWPIANWPKFLTSLPALLFLPYRKPSHLCPSLVLISRPQRFSALKLCLTFIVFRPMAFTNISLLYLLLRLRHFCTIISFLRLRLHRKHFQIVVNDTQSDSIQYLNFAKKWFIQYSIQYCFTQDSIQNIIQFKKNLLIQFKR